MNFKYQIMVGLKNSLIIYTPWLNSLSKPNYCGRLAFSIITSELSNTRRGFYILSGDEVTHKERVKCKSSYGIYKHAAVAADSKLCSDIGRDVMAVHGGNAIDAAVTTALCSSVVFPNSLGIGGGGFILLYHKKHGCYAIDARETAPAGASRDMFTKSGCQGAMSLCVPGLLKGMFEMHSRFGSLPWRTVVTPTINLLQEGFPLFPHTRRSLNLKVAPFIEKLPGFEMFFDADNQVKPVGSTIQMPKLAKTFHIIAKDPMSFYNGDLASAIVMDVQDAGGIINQDDLTNYEALFKSPTETTLPGDMTLYTVRPPAAGPVLSYIMAILSGYKMTTDDIATEEARILTYHRFIEAVKFSQARRTALGDEQYVDIESLTKDLTSRSYAESTRLRISDTKTQEFTYYGQAFDGIVGEGTSHLSTLDREGNAVSLTGSIGDYFGSRVIGKRTGIIFNDHMTDFSHPHPGNQLGLEPAKANFIEPGKRPLSAMCPTIVWDNKRNRVSVVTGAAGGVNIPAGLAQALMGILWFDESVPATLDKPKMFVDHQPPMKVITDYFGSNVLLKTGLEKKGHRFVDLGKPQFTVIQMIQIVGDSIMAASDFRKGGQPSGF